MVSWPGESLWALLRELLRPLVRGGDTRLGKLGACQEVLC